jgi:methionyl aminopeptidase
MSIDTIDDVTGMRRAGRVVADALAAMRAAVAPGVTTAALDEVAAAVFRQHGARSAPQVVYGFPGVTCISVNDEAVHGIPGPRALREGDLVSLDVTVELDGYYADAAETVAVGAAAPHALKLMAAAEQAFDAAVRVATPGTGLRTIGRAVEAVIERAGFRVLRDLSGHGIGRTIHEEPTVRNYDDRTTRDVLTDGLVLTIEPIISAGTRRCRQSRDGWTMRSADGSLAAHHEHTLIVRKDGCEIVTARTAA